ncbi:putative flippase GtrA [Endobacter medicaginis]|jgi:putative flippase GtrA|uniref:GtrA family protein n=1 Tax=Endobacter medicaginis TaxID=1181271 RepID=A0A850NSM7_9PROT|nr:GtrA family protein [Endobacter medicaginis]MBB3175314.1 putative flippase GtrA [Endobacter medicaginis]MCX5476914.1 GtrA family protein [Endobacter medicaginis]NVN30796.1 GtrA family protein [Endobacter medicaginis]
MPDRRFAVLELRAERLAATLLGPRLAALVVQFAQFGIVGLIGMAVDTATVYALRHPVGLIAAGFFGYLTAASLNWLLNRIWTFRPPTDPAEAITDHRMPAHRQWALFLLANLPGFVLNRGTFIALVSLSALCRAHPVLAIAAGSLAGMSANFTLSRRLMFR